ncbi:MAG: hypothetical protein ACOYNH_01330 [Bacteroidia bacterium]
MRPFLAPNKYHVFNDIQKKTVDLNPIFSFKSIDSIELRRI